MTNVQPPSTIALILLVTGTLGAFVSLLRCLPRGKSMTPDATKSKLGGRASLGLLVILIVAAGIRLVGIEARGMTHVEVYVPGLHLPESISEPPPRHTFGQVLSFHFHDEPHPQAYYFAMYAWTQTFGTSLISIRLPSLIFNVLGIALLFFMVRRETNTKAAFLAASLMALHGHQVYWSQQARMYAMGQFLGLVSIWTLLSLLRGEAKRYTGILYVLAAWGGVATKIFFWPFLAAQMLLVASLRDAEGRKFKGIFFLQAAVVILGTPFWTHALYQKRDAPLVGPSVDFAGQYFGLGFLFDEDFFSLPALDIPTIPWLFAIVLTVSGIALAIGKSTKRRGGDLPDAMSRSTLVLMALSSSIFICGLASSALARQPYLFASAILPIGALLLPWFQGKVADITGRCGEVLSRRHQAFPFLILSVVPFLLLFGVGAVSPILKTRGMITFVPYLVAVVAIGWSRFLTQRIGVVVVVLLFAWPMVRSLEYFGDRPEPNDHRGLARQLKVDLQSEDLIFAKKKDWVTTPSFYHLFDVREQLVTDNWESRAKTAAQSRIWVLTYSEIPAPISLIDSLSTRPILKIYESRRSRATLYGPLK